MFQVIRLSFEWYHFAGLRPSESAKQPGNWKVDMLTTACPGEPLEMISRTLKAMVAVSYPHETWLCDEGNDPYLRTLCRELGVHHVTRQTRYQAKAGNINHALQQTKGEICVILDPDHIPTPDFLDKVLPYFHKPETGYVQVVQAYYNQAESLVARAAAEQTYLYYGPYMQAMGHYGTAQAIGANCTFRRAALDSIGGHAPGLTEDMHTAMLLHAKGWKSVYVPEILSRGLVPSTLSAYYQQQLKWARGTFDLWIKVLPNIFHKLSWRQRLHYGILPLYYLFGLVTLINFLVPVISLFSGHYPWSSDFSLFLILYMPCWLIMLGLRLGSQQWVHEKREKGLHILGGILRLGSWWVYLLALLYTILNIKVPYLPTPKKFKGSNEFLLALPNLLMGILSLAAVVYGLQYDWQPYSWLMAAFAGGNALILLTSVFMGQHALIELLRQTIRRALQSVQIETAKLSYDKVNRVAIRGIFLCPIILPILWLPNALFHFDVPTEEPETILEKEFGGFYTGIYMPEADARQYLSGVRQAEQEAAHTFSIVSTYYAWSADSLPTAYWKSIAKSGKIPMITWEPWTNHFPEYSQHPQLGKNKKVFKYITEGYFDCYLDRMAVALRELRYPVFLRFAHEVDNPMYPWSASGGNTAEEFKSAWAYVHNRFTIMGVSNVSWVWTLWSPSAFDTYFPAGKGGAQDQYVDWVGLTCLNYGLAGNERQDKSFQELYAPFKRKMEELGMDLPVMLAEMGSVSYTLRSEEWLNTAFTKIQTDFPEIKAAVFFYSNQDKNWVTDWRPEEDKYIDWTFALDEISNSLKGLQKPVLSPQKLSLKAPQVSDNPEEKWRDSLINNLYFKGICYNPEHSWQDGHWPLTRRQVEHDFSQITEMGANAIRRYNPSVYDQNIFNEAEAQGLKIMYGFWFDPAVDFYKDSSRIAAYREEVLTKVKAYRDENSIAVWNIGNESWSLLKKYYAQPYLTVVRQAYATFLEELCQEIHQIDPGRPVITSEEHDHIRLNGVIRALHDYAPSLDAVGINSYYEENISELYELFIQQDDSRPYVVTEFGPKGYWSKEFGDYRDDTILLEAPAIHKARWYAEQWERYIAGKQPKNLGGFAFSWRDRYEGTDTWFGITDEKGRLKPSYYSLKRIWNQEDQSRLFPQIYIVGSWYPMKAGSKYRDGRHQSTWLSAAITNDYQDSLRYEWKIVNTQTWEEAGLIKSTLLNNQFVEIRFPDLPGNYRIYVYAVDSGNNVTTASRPISFH